MENLPKEKWSAFCDKVTKALTGLRAEIEVQSLDLGDQVEAENLPILGLVYDHKNDLFEVALEGLDHLILHPVELHVKGDAVRIESILVIDKEGTRHLVSFTEPLMLPAPSAE